MADSRSRPVRHTVLVVDCGDDRRGMLTALMYHDELRVLAASTVEQAQAWLSRERCDGLIVQHCPPAIDGEVMLRQLRHHPALAYTPIILVAGEDYDADSSYADAVVEEPWQLDQLVTILRKMMRRVAGTC